MIIKKILLLFLNYIYDATQFIRYSSVFSNHSQQKIEGKINYYSHSIEKGLINENLRYKYGTLKIKRLLHFLNIWLARNYDTNNSQFINACSVLEKYAKLHKNNNIDISDIITHSEYSIINQHSDTNVGGVLSFSSRNYFQHSTENFKLFSNSRHSVRHFNGELVPNDKIREVVSIAKNAPSVCNRQSVSIKIINNQALVSKVLMIQAGMNATAQTVQQLILVTSNLNSFVSEVERNQMFIDGGIFLQNLLYALHYHKISACALNWSKPFYYDIKIKKLLKLNGSERIIAVVAIGYPPDEFKVPFSKRKEISEVFDIIN